MVQNRLAAGLVVVAVAFNLRPALTGIGPILPEIMRSTGLDAAGASWLGTLPVLCLGLFGFAAPALARFLGLERAVLASVTALVAGLALRGIGGLGCLFAGSILAGAAIGLCNVLMPAVLKRDFAGQPALMAGIYTTALCLGAACAAALAVPVEQALGGSWAGSLGVWALPASGALVITGWVWSRPQSTPRSEPPSVPHAQPAPSLLRSALAWQVTAFMGLQSMLAYAMFAWLAPMLRSRGDDAHTAGLVLGISVLAQMAAALPAPVLAARMRDQSFSAAGSVLLIAASFVGLAVAPLAWQWVLAVLLGIGCGAAFALAIAFMVLRSGNGVVAAQLSSMSQGFGYALAACGPLVVGVLHGATGDWRGAEGLFLAGGAAGALAGALAGRQRVVGAYA